MAGHSKWAQIKRTKAVVDAKRGAVFTRVAREILVAARGGADPAGNFQLRTAIEKAKAAGMPNANIERAIAKGSGQLNGEDEQFESVRYEGYGPGGVAVLVEAFTDNRNRTAADLRLAFSKNGGNLGESGCVGYMFEQRSAVQLVAGNSSAANALAAKASAANQAVAGTSSATNLAPAIAEEALLESLLELEASGGPAVLGYELLEADGDPEAPAPALGGGAEVFAAYADLERLQDGLRRQGWSVVGWEHRWIPQTACKLSDLEQLRRCLRMLDAIDSLDDVRSFATNLEADPRAIEQLQSLG
jgi:YebC/PmpR family DNA-binding regulatory protein